MINKNLKERKMKLILILILIFICQPIFSQEVNSKMFEKIFEDGKSYTTRLKKGQIESLKKVNPPKDTWLFSKLEEYKRNLESENIIYGHIIMPSVNESFYSFNLFAYDIKKELYYFVAIVSFEILENDVKFNNSFLFTENKTLNDWWNRIFGFYQSDLIKKIPKKYLYKICPPPPFKDK